MPKPQPVDTPIVQLLQRGDAPQAAIDQLTPAARNLRRGDLIALWLDDDDSTQQAVGIHGRGLGQLKKPQLSTADINSILTAFDQAYAQGRSGPQPHGFFCNWSCCCCTPCCCCAVAVVKPVDPIA